MHHHALIGLFPFFFYSYRHHQDLHSFPTRRSSDLRAFSIEHRQRLSQGQSERTAPSTETRVRLSVSQRDRKSTRLNSSHRTTSYAVFCLKKKTSKSSTSAHWPFSK